MARTAAEMSPQEWRAYDPWAGARNVTEEERSQTARRRRQAWRVARQAARLLETEFGASRVAVFGSLAHRAWFTPWSDIDLAAWDIPPGRFYKAVAAMMDLSSAFKIDLLDPAHCSPTLRQAIQRDGRAI